MSKYGPPSREQMDKLLALYEKHQPPADAAIDPQLERMVEDFMGQIADKWTMLVLEALVDEAPLRFTQLGKTVGGISQKMLTQTVRHMERDGLLTRTVYPVVPPRVEYAITERGLTLSAAFCSVWVWAAENLRAVEESRRRFDEKAR